MEVIFFHLMLKTGAAFMLTPFGENRGSGTVHLPRSLSTLGDLALPQIQIQIQIQIQTHQHK